MKFLVGIIALCVLLTPAFLQDPIVESGAELAGTLYDMWSNNSVLDRALNNIAQNMSDEQLVGQLLMPSFEKTDTLESITQKICTYRLGGVMILRNDVTPEMVQYIKDAATVCMPDVPFWVSIDSEPGLMKYRMPHAGNFVDAVNLATAQDSGNEATRIANVLHRYHIDITFAPVLDSATNTAVIGIRSFGGNNTHRAQLGSAFTDASMNKNIIPTAKHFPGHGEALGDTHVTRQYVPGELTELDAFREVIKHGVPMVMIGHVIVQGGVWNSANIPATLSHTVITDLLRDELGFDGVVVTDSMSMGAVRDEQDAAVRAVQAGADIVLMSPNTKQAYTTLLKRIQTDANFKQQVQRSVERIVRLKIVQQWATK